MAAPWCLHTAARVGTPGLWCSDKFWVHCGRPPPVHSCKDPGCPPCPPSWPLQEESSGAHASGPSQNPHRRAPAPWQQIAGSGRRPPGPEDTPPESSRGHTPSPSAGPRPEGRMSPSKVGATIRNGPGTKSRAHLVSDIRGQVGLRTAPPEQDVGVPQGEPQHVFCIPERHL